MSDVPRWAQLARAPEFAEYPRLARAGAIALGVACHATFLLGIGAMIVGLHEGLRTGLGGFEGRAAWAANVALALQFPLIHSFGLTRCGTRWLDRIAPAPLGRDLRSTTYALIASLQLLLVFGLWSPTGGPTWRAEGAARIACELAFAGAWLLLGRSMFDAGLEIQSGFLGWAAVARGRAPAYQPFHPRGLFRFTRQPIYLAFALTLWTGPVMTRDRALLGVAWTSYCLLGPVWKERRYLRRDPEGYRRYQARVPYWLPRVSLRGSVD